MTTMAQDLVALSRWVDGSDENARRDPESLLWQRVAKVAEEAGEAVAALIGLTGGNPRKGQYGNRDAVVEELLDVAVTALAAVEHLRGHAGDSIELLLEKANRTAVRAGVAEEEL